MTLRFKTVRLLDEQIDFIVIEELQEAYRMNMQPNKIDCSDDILEPDENLLMALRTVLNYFMDGEQRKEWERELDETSIR